MDASQPLAACGTRITEVLDALDKAKTQEANFIKEARRISVELKHVGTRIESLRGDLDVALTAAAGAAGLT